MKLYLQPGWKYLGFFSFLRLLIRIKYGRGGIAYVNYILKKLNYRDYFFDTHNHIKIKAKYNDLISMSILKSGYYEKNSLHLAVKALQHKPGLFLDIGANFGLYTVYAAKVAGVPVIAIDGMPEAFSLLLENIEINRLRHQVVACNLVLSSKQQYTFFGNHDQDNLGSSRIKNALDKDRAGQFVVDATPFDGLLDFMKTDYAAISLVKIDIEGHEYEVLRDSVFFEKSRPSYILAEILEGYDYSQKLIALFQRHDYVPYTILGRKYKSGISIPESNLLFIDSRDLFFLLQVYENKG